MGCARGMPFIYLPAKCKKKFREMKAQRDLASKVSVAVEEVQLTCGLPASQKTSVVKYVFCSLMSW